MLVDADVRRASVGALLQHVEGKPGLVDAILDPACSLDQVLVMRPQFNLSFIHAGLSPSSSPYELLKSARFGALFEEARERFDYVILDTPPLAAVQDCRLIARWVDGFLVVVASDRTPRRLIEEALSVIEPAKLWAWCSMVTRTARTLDTTGTARATFRRDPWSPAACRCLRGASGHPRRGRQKAR